MGNRWKVEVASQMRFWCVPGAKMQKICHLLGPLFATIFGQKSKKTWKTNQYGHRALSRSAPRTQKKRFLRGSENVLFFGWFFHWKWPTFGGHFQWKNHPKIHADFEPEKVKIFDENQCKNSLSFCIAFLFFWFVFEKCLMQNTVLKQRIFQCF